MLLYSDRQSLQHQTPVNYTRPLDPTTRLDYEITRRRPMRPSDRTALEMEDADSEKTPACTSSTTHATELRSLEDVTAGQSEEDIEAAPAAPALPASVHDTHDYTCPVCLELLMRPVKLSCGHRFCRGCWIRILKSRDTRATARRTGTAACPFRCVVMPVVPEVDQEFARELEALFRCVVMPVVPEVDQEFARELEALFGVQYTERTPENPYALPDEERMATEINVWVAAGCELDSPEELATVAAAVAEARHRRSQLLRRAALVGLVLTVAVIVFVLLSCLILKPAIKTAFDELSSGFFVQPVNISAPGGTPDNLSVT